MVPPLDDILLADDTIVTHDLHPVLQLPIDIHVPDGPLARLLFIRHLNRNQSLDIVVHFVALRVVGRTKVCIEVVSLVPVERYPIHDVGQRELRLVSLRVKFEQLTRLWVPDLDREVS